MKTFSIRELEVYSEIKSHTLRMWEKRYAVFSPRRTEGNARLYTFEDLKRLLNIALLNKIGYRISRLATMQDGVIEKNISSLKNDVVQELYVLNQLILCMHARRIDDFENTLDRAVQDHGIDATLELILLFLEKVDLLAYNDTSYEVHFVVTAVRRKIIYAIETLPPVPAPAKSVLLFLPKSEHYDLVLLYMNYILKKQGTRVMYLGTNISNENLEQVALDKRPDFIVTYNTPQHQFKPNGFQQVLTECLPNTRLFVSGYQRMEQDLPESNIRFVPYRKMATVTTQ